MFDQQAQDLLELRENNFLEDFRHRKLKKLLNDFYTHLGQAKSIKKFPFPHRYGRIGLFFLLPLAMVSKFHKFGHWVTVLPKSIPSK